jgi:hypothetical protein
MRILFRNDETGCSCRLGEYKQEIRGFAERDDGTGTMRPADPPRLKLDRNNHQEDLRGGIAPYGVRSSLIGNTDTDEFLPVRETGCEYKASDSPGMENVKPGEHARFKFEFRGGPVDRRDRSSLGQWSEWVVEGDYDRPKGGGPPPPKKKPPPPPPPPPKQTEDETKKPEAPTVSPYEGPSIGPADAPAEPPLLCLGGKIGCETLDFLRLKGGKFLLVSDTEKKEAIDIEWRILIKARATEEPANTPINPDASRLWRQGLLSDAQSRVENIVAKDLRK